jgi:hypothetical protein
MNMRLFKLATSPTSAAGIGSLFSITQTINKVPVWLTTAERANQEDSEYEQRHLPSRKYSTTKC